MTPKTAENRGCSAKTGNSGTGGEEIGPPRAVSCGPMMVDTSELEDEIARLRDLDLPTLRARWRSVFRRKAPAPVPRHLLFRILAYRLQAERLGDLDKETVRLLDRIASGNGGNGHRSVVGKQSRFDRLQPGSMLVREWDGARQRPAFPEYSANGAVAGLNTALR